MAAGDTPLVVELERRPGTKESRWAHLLGAEPADDLAPSAPAPQTPTPPTAEPSLSARLDEVETRVEDLAAELARLREELGS
jgi:uncharacterized protein YceH (UPF0502 family)